jgi:hypothetical protein
MSTPPKKSSAHERSKNSISHLDREDYTATSFPASAKFGSGGLILPRERDASGAAQVIVASGPLDSATAYSRLHHFRFYRGKWFADCDGATYRISKYDVDARLHNLLSKCLVVDRAGRLRPFNLRRSNVSTVRCAMSRALTVCEEPMRELAAAGGNHG